MLIHLILLAAVSQSIHVVRDDSDGEYLFCKSVASAFYVAANPAVTATQNNADCRLKIINLLIVLSFMVFLRFLLLILWQHPAVAVLGR